MHAIQYFFVEAAASLWRGRKAAFLAVLTIAAGLFVLGSLLIVNTNLQQMIARWSQSAELSVYLKDDITAEQSKVVDDLIAGSGLASRRELVGKQQAAERFRKDFPDLAASADRLERNPFPASIEVQVKPELREADAAVDTLATTLSGLAGVADVRYDRRWLNRLNASVRAVRAIGLTIVSLLALASALTVANVIRLAALARRDEIEIMQLVGAPIAYVRGPFVVEGILQGGAGALVAIVSLWAVFAAVQARYGQTAADALGLPAVSFLPAQLWGLILLGGMLLGCVGGFVVARRVR
jgi:cell division transport system permease protein